MQEAIEDNEEFLDFVDHVENVVNNERLPKRYIRDAENPLDFYNDEDFRRRYRFNKNTFQHQILPMIADNLIKANNRGLPVPPLIQLCICLRYYATGSFQVNHSSLNSGIPKLK